MPSTAPTAQPSSKPTSAPTDDCDCPPKATYEYMLTLNQTCEDAFIGKWSMTVKHSFQQLHLDVRAVCSTPAIMMMMMLLRV